MFWLSLFAITAVKICQYVMYVYSCILAEYEPHQQRSKAANGAREHNARSRLFAGGRERARTHTNTDTVARQRHQGEEHLRTCQLGDRAQSRVEDAA